MLAFAYAECGLTVDEFFGLSFYEWSLEVYKVKRRNEHLKAKWENDAVFVRELMALIANVNRNSKQKPVPYQGKDFIKLSFDKEEIEDKNKRVTPEEVEAYFGKYLKKKKNG